MSIDKNDQIGQNSDQKSEEIDARLGSLEQRDE
jgi:hypothetical protein